MDINSEPGNGNHRFPGTFRVVAVVAGASLLPGNSADGEVATGEVEGRVPGDMPEAWLFILPVPPKRAPDAEAERTPGVRSDCTDDEDEKVARDRSGGWGKEIDRFDRD